MKLSVKLNILQKRAYKCDVCVKAFLLCIGEMKNANN